MLTVCALAATAALCAAAPAAAEGSVAHDVAQTPQAVEAFWTPQRMQSAKPADVTQAGGLTLARQGHVPPTARLSGRAPTVIPPSRGVSTFDYEPGTETGFPQRVHGKVFFTPVGGGLAMCSGTLVSSLLQNTVFTAAHCVAESGHFVSNLIFVPGYRDGVAPFGTFAATGMIAAEEWLLAESLSFDAAVVQLAVPLEAQLGARGVAFNKAPKSTYQIFGYPGKPAPYNGERLIACDAAFLALENTGRPFSTTATPCNMMQGSSGGGWVIPSGHVTSVVSHGRCDFDPSTCGQISGPYFGDEVKALYNRAGGSAQCPPAREQLKRAKKKFKRAKKASRRARGKRAERKTKRAERKLRRSHRVLGKAQARRDEFC
jgi:hypothetical protein